MSETIAGFNRRHSGSGPVSVFSRLDSSDGNVRGPKVPRVEKPDEDLKVRLFVLLFINMMWFQTTFQVCVPFSNRCP